MPGSAVETAVRTYVRAVSEPDLAVRASLFEACFAENVRMVTRSRAIQGRAALVADLERFLTDPRVLKIRVISVIDAQGTTFRYRAVADLRDGTSPETFDAGEIDAEGRISLILTFNEPLLDAEVEESEESESGG